MSADAPSSAGTPPETGSPGAERVTLADLALVPALEGARVTPPGASLDAEVSVVTLHDPDGPEAGGALVLAPGGAPDPPPAGCVAVVARSAPGGRPGVPTFVLPPGASWSDVLADLVAALEGGGALAGAARARGVLREPLLAGGGFTGLAEAARELVGAPVAILDEYLDLRGAAGLAEEAREELDEAVGRARGHGPASMLGPFIADELGGRLRTLVPGPREAIGVIVVWTDEALDAGRMAVVDVLAEVCAVERAREDVRVETESRLRGDLIEELMAGEAVGRESVVRRARHLGADLSTGAVAILGRLQDPHTEGRSITDPRLVRRFLQQGRAAVDLHRPRALVDWSDGRLVALLPPAPGEDGAEASAIEEDAVGVARRLLAATRETVPGLALTLALSRFTAEPERLGAGLDEARLALSIGERLGRLGEVVTFEETGTYKLLFQIFADRPKELASFYEQTLAPLVRYDEQYQTDLIGTLSTYLGHDCNLAATAGTLYTHRHTVRYRLDRIAELSGLDVSKTDDREKLSLGLKAMRLLGRRVATVADRPRRGGR